MARLESPGVSINEVDLSLRPIRSAATTIFIPGFAQKGPTDDAIKIASISEFEQIYGKPTNGAERYFYHTVYAALQSPADVLVTRLPYGTAVDNYSVLGFPAIYLSGGCGTGGIGALSDQHYTQTSGVYMLGAPTHYTLTRSQYDSWLQGSLFNYSTACGQSTLNSGISSLKHAALIIGNQSQSDISSQKEGYYIGIVDNTTLSPGLENKSIRRIYTLSGEDSYQILSTDRIGSALTGSDTEEGSVSQIIESGASSFDLTQDRSYDDILSICVFKLSQSVFSKNSIQLSVNLNEVYQGSLDSHRQQNSDQGGPATSYFIDTIASKSPNIIVKTNPYLSKIIQGNTYLDNNGLPAIKIRIASPGLTDSSNLDTTNSFTSATNMQNRCSFIGLSGTTAIQDAVSAIGAADALYPAGVYNPIDLSLKIIGSVPTKLTKIFDTFKNSDVYPFDIAVEAGLGTIYAAACANDGSFDDFTYFDIGSAASTTGAATKLYKQSQPDSADDSVSNYRAVLNTFQALVDDVSRKDFIIIADPIINIFIQGGTFKNINKEGATVSKDIYYPLRNLYSSYNTSYITTYATCVKVNDPSSGMFTWVPFSGYAASIMANTDANFQPWYAPAGFTRGVVGNALDIAIYPRQKDRDTLYKSSFNPVAFFPNEGFVIYGQKTLLKKPSAFDRINVRRLFISLEKVTKETLKFFVFEPNTLLTRTRVINTLTPIFENAKNTEGVYDYLIICDERNNTPDIIDANELVVDIYLKPVRTAEFILCNFYATRTSVDFQEIVG